MHIIKRTLLLLLAVILLSSCKKESKTINSDAFPLSKTQMIEDYQLFRDIFEQANAGLYKYHSKAEIDSVFSTNKNKIQEGISYRDFYNVLWNVIDYTGSCHNKLTYPDSLDRAVSKQKIFFPIPLKYISGKLYTNTDYDGIPAGSEIVTVNGMKSEHFSSLVSKYVSTDGINKTGKYANIATDWLPFYIYLAIGSQKQFALEYKDLKTIRKSNVLGVTYSDFYKNYRNRYSRKFEDQISEDYTYRFLDSINTGLLDVHTFGMGGPESEGHKKYASFLDSVFTNIQTKKVENLIVDIRGNGGGNDPNDLLMYSYLANRYFKENTSAFTTFQEIPYQQYYIYDDIDELTKELKEEHSIYQNGKYYQNKSFNEVWNPNKNAFQGNIILLIDPFVASAGSLFASLIKNDKHTVVIGEETLGGYYGHTGHIPMTYELPNSKLQLTFSIVDLEQDVKQLPDENYGDGIMPDFKVTQSYYDFMNNKDTQLHFAIKQLKKMRPQKRNIYNSSL